MQKFATPAPVSTVLDIPAGRIRLVAADRVDTTVEVLPADASKGRDVKAAEQVRIVYDDGVLHIAVPDTHRVLGNSGFVEVTVQLPAGSRVQAGAAGGEFRTVGRLDDVTFEGAQGSVKVDEAASARLTLAAGDITLGRLDGTAHLATQKGDLTVTEAVGGTLTLRTEQGDIAVTTARGTSAALDAGTTHGRVTDSLHNTQGADAALTVHATTAHGDITARSL
ncbi:DUF4097 family beta strand repeat-containing protein [Streptomyces sp. NPDC052043]|uniref:DUF4097 family beta strand repeat-containing protein n=1 Tax=Streptomyces sp. NPDC052043 TaxID=3365684 RepID=UPI0037D72320